MLMVIPLILFLVLRQLFHHSYISRTPTNPIYLPINTQNNITSITMRVTDNLNRDLDLRGEPVNYLLHLRKARD